MHQAIVLDSQIRDFVFLPLIAMIFIIGVMRIYLRPAPESQAPKTISVSRQSIEGEPLEFDFKELKEEIPDDAKFGNAITRAAKLRKNGNYLPSSAVKNRKAFFC